MKFFLKAVLLMLIVSSCQKEEQVTNELFSLTTDSDSAAYHYQAGWQQIMDFGNYSQAEEEWRKAKSYDDGFLLNLAVLARVTQDLEERLDLTNQLESRKNELIGDERKVLDIYLALTHYTNLRDQNSTLKDSAFTAAMDLSYSNMAGVVHRNPEEVYLKSEYFETLHRKIGAKQTLDSIQALTLPTQLDNPFILGYRALLYAELENYDAALLVTRRLVTTIGDRSIAKPYAILANIYFTQGDYARATLNVERAYSIDPNNLDVLRIKQKLDEID